jgi:hypothetical protein
VPTTVTIPAHHSRRYSGVRNGLVSASNARNRRRAAACSDGGTRPSLRVAFGALTLRQNAYGGASRCATLAIVRTTVNLEPDVAAAVQALRDERKIGLSEAVNELIRAGLQVPKQRRKVEWKTYPMGLEKVDITSISAALEELDGPDWR